MIVYHFLVNKVFLKLLRSAAWAIGNNQNVSRAISASLMGYLGNWPHNYRVVRSKLVFYNVLTTSINNTHIKRKNSKTICSSETFFTSLWHSHRRVVHSASSTFTFFKLVNCTHVACRVYLMRYLHNAMQCRFSISALGSVYDVPQTNLRLSLWTKFTNFVKDQGFPEVSWINPLRAWKWEDGSWSSAARRLRHGKS
jgi:hypothetical protein